MWDSELKGGPLIRRFSLAMLVLTLTLTTSAAIAGKRPGGSTATPSSIKIDTIPTSRDLLEHPKNKAGNSRIA